MVGISGYIIQLRKGLDARFAIERSKANFLHMSMFDTDTSLNPLIGKTMDEARSLFPNRTFRIRIEDGEAYIGDCDFYPDRINVELKKKRIIKMTIG